jgi:hypothetical protein
LLTFLREYAPPLHGPQDQLEKPTQPTALFTSAPIFAPSAAVSSFSANEVGHMAPSSRSASSPEAERRVPRAELLGALEEADDLALLVGVGGHPVPGLRREGRRACLDDLVEPLGHGAVRSLHLGDLREQVASPAALFLFARSSAFSSLARSLIAARSSSVNPSDFFAPIVPSRAVSSGSCPVRQEEVYLRSRALTSRFLIGPVARFATRDGIHPAVARAARLSEAAAEGARRRAADREAVRTLREPRTGEVRGIFRVRNPGKEGTRRRVGGAHPQPCAPPDVPMR